MATRRVPSKKFCLNFRVLGVVKMSGCLLRADDVTIRLQVVGKKRPKWHMQGGVIGEDQDGQAGVLAKRIGWSVVVWSSVVVPGVSEFRGRRGADSVDCGVPDESGVYLR